MSIPWKPLVQKAMLSLYSWGRRSAKLGTNPRASCAWKHAGMVTAGPVHEAAGLKPAGTRGSAPGVALGHLCARSHWELQPYHEGVGLGTERVGEPVDGEGHVGHHVEVAALHGVLRNSRGAQRCCSTAGPSWRDGGPRALPPSSPHPRSHLSIHRCGTNIVLQFFYILGGTCDERCPGVHDGLAAIHAESHRPIQLDTGGGGKRKGPGGTCPAPLLQPNPSLPAQHHSLVQLDLPVPLLGDRHPVQGPREARGVKATKKQFSSQGGFRIPGGRRRCEGFPLFYFAHCILNGWIYTHWLPTNA